MTTDTLPLTRASVIEAHKRIEPYIHRTPVLTSKTVNRVASTPRDGECEGIISSRSGKPASPKMNLFFKAENLQKGGAFKIRGATHAISHLTKEEREKGVVTHSSGNHAQALSIAAASQNPPIECHVVMPSISTPSKIAATQSYGSHVVFSGSTEPERVAVVEKIQAETGAILVPPYNHPHILLGQGTMALELIEQAREMGAPLDAIIAPVGGGGMLSGIAVACQGTGVRVFGAEPEEGADDCKRGLAQGKRIEQVKTLTIADGLRTPVGDITYGIIERQVKGVYSVSEEEIKMTMKLVLERMKVLVEPSGCVPLAVLLFNEEFRAMLEKEAGPEGWNIGVVFSGGNTTIDMMMELFKT